MVFDTLVASHYKSYKKFENFAIEIEIEINLYAISEKKAMAPKQAHLVCGVNI